MHTYGAHVLVMKQDVEKYQRLLLFLICMKNLCTGLILRIFFFFFFGDGVFTCRLCVEVGDLMGAGLGLGSHCLCMTVLLGD